MACTAPLGIAAPAGSRKTVTIVFSDLVGSTALGEALDSEALREVLDRYFTEMRSSVERHGGIVEKYIGDAVMAVFGSRAPTRTMRFGRCAQWQTCGSPSRS